MIIQRRNTFPCDQCRTKTNTLKELDDHIESAHGRARPFPCEFCNYSTKSDSELVKHLDHHHNIKSGRKHKDLNSTKGKEP